MKKTVKVNDLIVADTHMQAAKLAVLDVWIKDTEELIKSTFKQVSSTAKTHVFEAIWHDSLNVGDDKVTIYVQEYDIELNLYHVIVKY